MMVLGIVTKAMMNKWKNKSLYLPQFHFYERHSTRITTALPEAILSAIAAFDIQQDRIIKSLMFIRQLPQNIFHSKSLGTASPFGLHRFTLLTHSQNELCYGLRGQFWRADFGLEPVANKEQYAADLPAGSAKLLMRYQVRQLATDNYQLCTETFIYCPESITRLKMSGYWLIIRAGSGLIRRRMLKGIKRQLEAGSGQ